MNKHLKATKTPHAGCCFCIEIAEVGPAITFMIVHK